MNIFDVIRSDHKKVLGIIDEMKRSSGSPKRDLQQKFSRMRDELLPHMYAEEHFFYQFILDKGSEREIILEAVEEHRAARSIMQDIESTSADDERWMAKLVVLSELLRHHIEEEETEVFDAAEKFMDDRQAQDMGNQFKSIEQGEMAAR